MEPYNAIGWLGILISCLGVYLFVVVQGETVPREKLYVYVCTYALGLGYFSYLVIP